MNQVSVREAHRGKIWFPRIPIESVMLEERANSFKKRSLKKHTKLDLLMTAISMVDLTTLEGADTLGKVRNLCYKAISPLDPSLTAEVNAKLKTMGQKHTKLPRVAAVCVYPTLVKDVCQFLQGSGVNVASVATGFPSGQVPLDVKKRETKYAIEQGANEIDMVINRNAFFSGRYQEVYDEVRALKDICGDDVHLKVILETGDLKTYDMVWLASWLSMEAGADFIKTSTGKLSQAATMPMVLVMLQAVLEFYDAYGKKIGVKPAGGIKSSKDCLAYLVMVAETLGEDWMNPHLFRFGASSLLNDLLRQILKQVFGEYYYYDCIAQD